MPESPRSELRYDVAGSLSGRARTASTVDAGATEAALSKWLKIKLRAFAR
jgi:hypothetical protein